MGCGDGDGHPPHDPNREFPSFALDHGRDEPAIEISDVERDEGSEDEESRVRHQ